MSSRRDSTLLAIPKDRVITQFPKAYHPDTSPYQTIQFHPKVKAACAENRTGRVGLKICKAVIVGDVAVGKTCVVNRFCHDVFNRDYKATIGVDFEVEKFSVLAVPFTLQMWDTAGQERFKCIAASYYRGANIARIYMEQLKPIIREFHTHAADIVQRLIALDNRVGRLEESREASGLAVSRPPPPALPPRQYPIQDTETLTAFEAEMVNEAAKGRAVLFLSAIGGSTLRETTGKIGKWLLCPRLAFSYTLTGKVKEKGKLRDFPNLLNTVYVVIVAFDLTEEESLQHVTKWMEEATENADEPVKFLVGTKRDLLTDAEYAEVEARAMVLAKNLEAEFWPTSSRSGENVQEFFRRMVALVFDLHLQKELEACAVPAKKIGKGTASIQVQRESSFHWDKKKKAQCCK